MEGRTLRYHLDLIEKLFLHTLRRVGIYADQLYRQFFLSKLGFLSLFVTPDQSMDLQKEHQIAACSEKGNFSPNHLSYTFHSNLAWSLLVLACTQLKPVEGVLKKTKQNKTKLCKTHTINIKIALKYSSLQQASSPCSLGTNSNPQVKGSPPLGVQNHYTKWK